MVRIAIRLAAGAVLGAAVMAADGRAADEAAPSIPQALLREWSGGVRVEAPPRFEPRPPAPTLTLEEAVALALERDPTISIERLGYTAAVDEINRQRAVFDPRLSLFGETGRDLEPSGSALSGADSLRIETTSYGAALEKLLRSGGELGVELAVEELRSNSTFIGLRPQYRPELSLRLTQPLLRGFGPGLSVLLVHAAEVSSQAAWEAKRTALADRILDVVNGYWGLYRVRERLEAEQEGLEWAERTAQDNEARVRAGLRPRVALLEAQAEVAARRERVAAARRDAEIALEELRSPLRDRRGEDAIPPDVELVSTPPAPIDPPDSEASVRAAWERRPEILAADRGIEERRLRLRLAQNELLPDLELEARYGVTGLSGDVVPRENFRTGETETSAFGGSRGRAYDRLAGGDFNSWFAGVRLEIPLENREARASYRIARSELRIAEEEARRARERVQREVRRALAEVEAGIPRLEAARLSHRLARENLELQEKRHGAGLTSTTDLLRFQEAQTRARALEHEAEADQAIARARLDRAMGKLQDRFGVAPAAPPLPELSPWARF